MIPIVGRLYRIEGVSGVMCYCRVLSTREYDDQLRAHVEYRDGDVMENDFVTVGGFGWELLPETFKLEDFPQLKVIKRA